MRRQSASRAVEKQAWHIQQGFHEDFSQLGIGSARRILIGDPAFETRFIFYGKTYAKIALNMAEDEKCNGNIFQSETKVEPIECKLRIGILYI